MFEYHGEKEGGREGRGRGLSKGKGPDLSIISSAANTSSPHILIPPSSAPLRDAITKRRPLREKRTRNFDTEQR